MLTEFYRQAQDILIAHFSTESPPRKRKRAILEQIQYALGFCAISVGLTHSVLEVCGEPGRDMAMPALSFYIYMKFALDGCRNGRKAIMRKTLK